MRREGSIDNYPLARHRRRTFRFVSKTEHREVQSRRARRVSVHSSKQTVLQESSITCAGARIVGTSVHMKSTTLSKKLQERKHHSSAIGHLLADLSRGAYSLIPPIEHAQRLNIHPFLFVNERRASGIANVQLRTCAVQRIGFWQLNRIGNNFHSGESSNSNADFAPGGVALPSPVASE